MEKPWTSNAAQYYAVASLFVVGVSTLTFVLSTMEDAKSEDSGEEANPFLLTAINITGKMNLNYLYTDLFPDIVCVAIFTLEYFIRFLCSPKKKEFVLQPMNLSK